MSEIKHYGVKGMKWGVRRYQNADGSRKPAGKKRERKGGSLKKKYVKAMDKANAKSAARTKKRRAAIKSAPKKALSGYKKAMEKADAKSAAGTAKRKAAIKSAPKKAATKYVDAMKKADQKGKQRQEKRQEKRQTYHDKKSKSGLYRQAYDVISKTGVSKDTAMKGARAAEALVVADVARTVYQVADNAMFKNSGVTIKQASWVGKELSKSAGRHAMNGAKADSVRRLGKNVIQAATRNPVRYVDGSKMTNVVNVGTELIKR